MSDLAAEFIPPQFAQTYRRVGERPVVHHDDPIGGVSPINETLLFLALVGHVIEEERQREAATARLLKALQEDGVRPRESRFSQLSKREHLNVADAKGRRHGRTTGPSRNGWIPVKWSDTGERETVRESDLLMRFTVQSVGFVPKSERDAQAAEAGEAEVSA